MKPRKPRNAPAAKKRTAPRPKRGSSSPSPASSDRRALEKQPSDISKLLRGRQFASMDEVNAFLQNLMASGEIPSPPSESPLEQAQDLMYEAWDASGKRRITLARQALEVSADCADAYVLLAEETARSLEEAIGLYEQGVKAGERALGEQAFEENVGHFWGVIETRPYMRARAGLAHCLWLQGKHYQAIEHYKEMLRLNPNDNQGIRYLLADCLLEEGLDDELGKLLGQYGDEASAEWLYTRALWLYRREQASAKANAALKDALKQNRFVPLFLQGKSSLPQHPPAYVGFGDESEAVSYVMRALKHWHTTPGALAWLARVSAAPSRSRYVH